LAVAGLALCVAGPAASQELSEEVTRIRDGWTSLRVELREGVEVCDHGIRWYSEAGERRGHWHSGGSGAEVCDDGPLQLDFRVVDGTVREIEAGRISSRDGAVDLGERPPLEVSDYLVSMPYLAASDDAAEDGLFLSRLPRGADPTEGILRVARDRELSTEVRKTGLFWAGQLATEVVVEPLQAVAVEEDADQQVREAAVFALSQHQGEAAVPALMELALEAPHPGTRRSAMFWLAQRDDPAVADFLADVILGRRGG
jgi:hypothetical protein